MKGDIYSNTIIVGFNTPLTSVDRSSRQKTTKATEVLNYTIDQLNLIDIQLRKKKKGWNTLSFQLHLKHCLGWITY